MYDVFVIDLLSGEVLTAKKNATIAYAKAFRDAFENDDSFVVFLPAGFCVCNN